MDWAKKTQVLKGAFFRLEIVSQMCIVFSTWTKWKIVGRIINSSWFKIPWEDLFCVHSKLVLTLNPGERGMMFQPGRIFPDSPETGNNYAFQLCHLAQLWSEPTKIDTTGLPVARGAPYPNPVSWKCWHKQKWWRHTNLNWNFGWHPVHQFSGYPFTHFLNFCLLVEFIGNICYKTYLIKTFGMGL